MKILHYHHNGVGVVLSNEMNTRPNITSKVFTTARHPFGFKADYVLPPNIPILGSQNLSYWILFSTLHKRYDILHSHDGIPLPQRVLRKWSGRVVQHYHNPLFTDFYPHTPIPSFVSTPAMTLTIPNSVWMPLPIDPLKFHPGVRLYNPYNPVIGFSYNISADKNKLKYIPLNELMQFSRDCKQVIMKGLSDSIHHTKMPAYYQSIDIYVDRLGLDSYGWQAIEAAACGCVVVTQAKNSPEDCPFSYATPETLSNVLESIITLPVKMFINMKHQSIEYANKYHNVSTLVDRYLQYYSNLGDLNAFKNCMEHTSITAI
ncbi:MAG: glycosyltransferase [Candidatus Paceibacterota bacterium]